MPATYDLGDSVSLLFTVKVRDPLTGVETLTNATVALTVTKPDGSTQNPSINNAATGKYVATVAPDQAGEWLYKWTATGAATTAEDGAFIVEPNLAATLYTTVGEVRAQLSDDVAQSLDAGQLEAAIRAASRAVDAYCNRRFWLDVTPVTRTFRPQDPRWTYLPDIGSKTGMVIKVDTAGDGSFTTTWTIGTHFQLEPLDADANGGAYRWNKLQVLGNGLFPQLVDARPALQATVRWGWSQHPEPIRAASTLKAVGLFKRRDAPFGVAGVNDFGPIRIGGREDGDVLRLLDPFCDLAPAG